MWVGGSCVRVGCVRVRAVCVGGGCVRVGCVRVRAVWVGGGCVCVGGCGYVMYICRMAVYL